MTASFFFGYGCEQFYVMLRTHLLFRIDGGEQVSPASKDQFGYAAVVDDLILTGGHVALAEARVNEFTTRCHAADDEFEFFYRIRIHHHNIDGKLRRSSLRHQTRPGNSSGTYRFQQHSYSWYPHFLSLTGCCDGV